MLTVSSLRVSAGDRLLLDGVSLTVARGELLAIQGPSGSGKTTLLNCLGGLLSPDSGSVLVDGVDLATVSPGRRAAFRLTHIGIVFQFVELIPELDAVSNVALPLRLAGVGRVAAAARATQCLSRLGLSDRLGEHPETLSGGEQQRVGIARALVHNPPLLLADEPTGMLDEVNTQLVTGLLRRISRESRVAVVIVTHDPVVAAYADRTLLLARGSLSKSPTSAVAVEPT